MKAKLHIESTKIKGYQKLYLQFYKPRSELETELLKALGQKRPKYIAGKEPRFSLYVGSPLAKEVEIASLSISWNTSGNSISMSEFWSRMRKQDPTRYKESCRCGCWFKSVGDLQSHRSRCAVLKYYQPLFERISKMQLVKESEGGRKSKKPRKSKRSDDSKAYAKLIKQKRITRAKSPKKKVQRRGVRSK